MEEEIKKKEVSTIQKTIPQRKRTVTRKKRLTKVKKFYDGPRIHPVTIMLTEREHMLLEQHLRRKRVSNRSKYLRSILLKDIVEKLTASPPSLFDRIANPPSED